MRLWKRVAAELFLTSMIILGLLFTPEMITGYGQEKGYSFGDIFGSGSADTLSDGSMQHSWPMFRHDLHHTGYSSSLAPHTNITLWEYTTGDEVVSSPAVVDGMVFVGSLDDNLYALNETTGDKIWNYSTGHFVRSSPAVSNGMVFVGSLDNRTYALDQFTGNQIWNYTTEGSIVSSPAVADGTVFVGSTDRKVYALNQSTGEQIWNYTTGSFGYVYSSPSVVDGMVFIGSRDMKLYALNATTGSEIWSYATEGGVDSSPAVVDGMVFVGSSDSRVYALNQSTGEQIWNCTTAGSVDSSPAVADGTVFVGGGNYIYALNQSTGEQVWNYTTGSGYIDSSPALADGLVFVGSWWAYRVYALNETNGLLVWSYTTGDKVCSSPAVADGHVFVGSSDGKVYCFGPPMLPVTWPMFRHDPHHTGYSFSVAPTANDTRWFFTAEDRIVSSPAVADGMVFVGSWDNNMYALDENIGTKIWNYTTGDDVRSSPALADGMVFVGSFDYRIYALNQSTGEQKWNYTTGNRVFSSPVVANGMVFVGSKDWKIYALNQSTGEQKWNYTTGGLIDSSPAVADGMVFVGSWDKNVYALDATAGTKIWNYTTGSRVSSSPAVIDGVVFIGSKDGNIYALNQSTGEKIWNYTTSSVVDSSPAIVDGMVFVGSENKNIYALNATTGTKIWNYTTEAGIDLSSPAVADGTVFVGSLDKNVYALNETTGDLVWRYKTGDWVESSPAVADGSVFVGSYDNAVYCFSSIPFSPAVLYEEETTISLFNEELAHWSLTKNTLQDPWFEYNAPPFLTYGGSAGVTLDVKVLLDMGFTFEADVPVSIVTVIPEAVPKNSFFNFMIRLAQRPASLKATYWLNLSISLGGSYNFNTITENITSTSGFPQELKYALDNLTELDEAMSSLADFLRLASGQNITAWIDDALSLISSIRSLINNIVGYVDKTYSIHLGYGRISKTIEVNPWDILTAAGINLDQYINDAKSKLNQVESLLISMKGAVGEIETLVDALLELVADFPTGSFNYAFEVIYISETLNGAETLYGNFSLPLGDYVFDLRNDLPSVISEKINNLTRMMYIQTLLATPVTVDALFDIGLVPQLSVSAWIEGNVTATGASIPNPSFSVKNYSDYANIQAHSFSNQTQPLELSISDLNYKINASFSIVPFADLYLQVPYLTIPLVNIVELLPENVKSQLVFTLPIGETSIPIPGTIKRNVIMLSELEGVTSGFTVSEKTINQTINLVDWKVKKDTLADPFLSFDQSFFTYESSDGLNFSGAILLDAGLNINFSLPLRFRQIVPNLGVPGRAFTMSTQLMPSNPEIQVHYWSDLDLSLSTSWNLETILQSIINDPSYPSNLRNMASQLLTIINELYEAVTCLGNVASWSASLLIGYLDTVENMLDSFMSELESFTYSITISVRICYYYNPVTGTRKYWTFSHTFSFNFLDALSLGSSYLRSLMTGAVSSVISFKDSLKNGIATAESVAMAVIDLLEGIANFLMKGSLSPTLNLLDIDFNEVYPMTQVYGHPLRLPIGLHSYDLRYDLPRDFVATTNKTKLGIDALTHFYVSFSIIPAPVTVDLMADVNFKPILKTLGNITGTVTASNALFETGSGPRSCADYVLDEYDEAAWFRGKLNPGAISNFDFTFNTFKYNFEAWIEIMPSVELLLDIPLVPIPIKIVDLYDLIDPEQVQVIFFLGATSVALSGFFEETILKAET